MSERAPQMKRFILPLILLIFSANAATAQNVTGQWEGFFQSNEYLQLNMTQNGTSLCGFTYDFVANERRNTCKAYYAGKYDKGIILIKGTSFIYNSGSHVLMVISLIPITVNGELVLRGRVSLRTIESNDLTDVDNEIITLRRMNVVPRSVPGTNSPCYTENAPDDVDVDVPVTVGPEKKKDTKTPEVVSKKKVEKVKPEPKKKVEVEPKKKEVKKVEPEKKEKKVEPKVIVPQPKIVLPERILERKQIEFSRLKVDVRNINLKLYDNGDVDGDVVTLYYNGKLLVNKQTLSEKAIEINLQLDPGVKMHELTLFAENLGSIPPNTALIVVTAGKKRYELRSSADLKKNAVLIFEYVGE